MSQQPAAVGRQDESTVDDLHPCAARHPSPASQARGTDGNDGVGALLAAPTSDQAAVLVPEGLRGFSPGFQPGVSAPGVGIPNSPRLEPSTVDRRPSTIAAAFANAVAQGRAALIPFVTGGYPTLDRCEALIAAIAAGGADLIEIGVPFSDPLADGTTVQATSQKALDQGTTLGDCLELARRAREKHGIAIPLLFMGYANPFYQYGLDRLAADMATVGVDGLIVPDLPSDESEEFAAPLRAHGRDLVFLLAPTSTERRIADAAARASGFIYCVALTGVTGARDRLSDQLPAYIARVRAHTDLPLAIGFGISTPDHARQAAALADGVVVASALINHLDALPPEEQPAAATAFVRALADATEKPTV